MSRNLVAGIIIPICLVLAPSALGDVYDLTATDGIHENVCTLRTTNTANAANKSIVYNSSIRCNAPLAHLAIRASLENSELGEIDGGGTDYCDKYTTPVDLLCGFDRSYNSGNQAFVAYDPRVYIHHTHLYLTLDPGNSPIPAVPTPDPWITDPRLTCRPTPITDSETIQCELDEPVPLQ